MLSKQAIIKRIVLLAFASILFLPDLYSQSYNVSTCSGTAFSFKDPSLPNGTTYTWGAPVISPAGAISNASAQGSGQLSVSQTLTNTTTATATATYTVTSSLSTTFQLIVTVNPLATLSSTLTPSAVCSNTAFSYSPTSATTGTTFNWSRAVVAGISNNNSTGSGNINETLINTTVNTVAVNYAYTLTANGCSNSQTVVVNINPTPTLSSTLTPASICSNTLFNYNPTSATAGTSFNWSRAAVAGISNAASSGSGNPNETLINTTANAVAVNYVFTLTANGCGNNQTVTVNINPTPTLSSTVTPPAICSNTSFNYTPASATTGTTFNWSRAVVAGISNNASSGSGSPNETLINTTANPIAVNYIYTLTANGCSNNQTVTVTVNPSATLSSTLTPPAICSGTVFNYIPSSATAGVSFNWSRLAIVGISNSAGQGTNNPNEILNNSTTSPITVNYIYTLTVNGCNNNQTVSVLVNPSPALTSTLTPSSICSGSTFNYSPSSTLANTSFAWTRNAVAGINNGNSTSGTNNPAEQLTNSTLVPIRVNYTYTLTNNTTTCSNTEVVPVTVNPVPSVTDQTLNVCSNNTFMSSPNFVPINTLYTWTTPTVTIGSVTGGSAIVVGQTFIGQALTNTGAGTATIVYTVTPNTNGCVGSNFFVTVNVSSANSSASLNSSLTPPAICSGTVFSYTPTSTTAGVSFAWKRFFTNGISNAPASGSGNPNEILFNNTYQPVTTYYAYTLTDVSGCSNTQQVAILVNPGTSLSSTQTPTPICSNTVFSYLPTSNTSGTSFNWSRSAVAGISNPSASGTNNPNETLINTTTSPISVTYNYFLNTTNGCINNQTVTVQVNPTPLLTTTLNPTAICSGTTFNYIPTSNVSGSTFNWSRSVIPAITNGAASGTNNPAEILVNNSLNPVAVPYNYIVTANGCSTNETVSVTVNPTPVVSNLSTASCSNTLFSVTPTGVPAATKYTWTMPVYNPPASIIGGSAQGTAQTNISQTIVNQTLNPATAVYTVTPTANSCSGASFTVTVTLNPVPSVGNKLLPSICSGTAFNYTPTGVPAATLYTWSNPLESPFNSLSGGSAQPISQTNISQTLNSTNNISDTATYTVTPSTNGCAGNTFTLIVPVSPVPSISNITDTICTGTSFSILPAPVPVNTTYTWPTPTNFPFGAIVGGTAQVTPVSFISQNLTNTSNNPAQTVYNITPVSGSCAGNPFTAIITVGVNLPFINNQNITICSGTSFDATPSNVAAGTTYTWSIPSVTPANSVSGISATTSPQNNVSQTLINLLNTNATVVYSVIPTYTGCQGNIFSATINVLPSPKATITGKPVVCRYPLDTLTVSFTGTAPWSFAYTDSTGATFTKTGILTSPYIWTVPSVPNLPSRIFKITNVKDLACLNNIDTFSFSQNIMPLPVGKIISLHGNYLCNNIQDTLFVNASAFDTLSYQWQINGSNIPGAVTDSIVTSLPGSYNAVLTNQYGCVDTAAQSVNMILILKPNLQFSYDSRCINQLINLKNLTDTTSTGPIQWLWNLGDSTTSSSFNASVTYPNSGDRHIKLTAMQLNCPSTPVSKDTTLNIEFPIDAVRMPSVSAYKGVPTPISARLMNGYRYQWVPSWGLDYPDSSTTNFNYQNTIEYLIHLISPAGCVTADTVLVRVFDNNLIDIMVPKSFTPNNDGVNDVLYPYLAGIKEFHYFRIYNRYGQLMFQTTNPDMGWDGNFNGQHQPMSVYIWMVEGITNNGTLFQKKGETLLLR